LDLVSVFFAGLQLGEEPEEHAETETDELLHDQNAVVGAIEFHLLIDALRQIRPELGDLDEA
jgi:hypothetical protein